MSAERAADAREAPRSNMFIAAMLNGAGISTSVKIRNMSATGALVEAAVAPPAGAQVRVMRGSLTVSGTVIWSSDGRCGLHFSSHICVREWLAPPANAAQQRVDEVMGVLKLGAVPLPDRAPPPSTSPDDRHVQLADHLGHVSRLLGSLGDELSEDAHVLQRHGAKLQNLDIAVQTIAAVADALGGTATEQSIHERLENLRASSAEALKGRA